MYGFVNFILNRFALSFSLIEPHIIVAFPLLCNQGSRYNFCFNIFKFYATFFDIIDIKSELMPLNELLFLS